MGSDRDSVEAAGGVADGGVEGGAGDADDAAGAGTAGTGAAGTGAAGTGAAGAGAFVATVVGAVVGPDSAQAVSRRRRSTPTKGRGMALPYR
jgi:hypothetical protein